MARANLELGTASRVLVRLGEFEARHFSTYVKRARSLEWGHYVALDGPVEFRVTCRRSRLFHSGAVAARTSEAMALSLGRTITTATPETPAKLAVIVRIDRDVCEISVDTSGESLHRRGWRLQTAKAPLREDLAHALLLVSGWDRASSLLDPMMGSGTLVIEAARLARHLAPGRSRTFALESMPFFDAACMVSVRNAADARTLDRLSFPILGRDRARGALEAAQANAVRAGVDKDLTLEMAALASTPLPAVGTVVCNPPYGLRISADETIEATYRELGRAIEALECPPRVAIVTNERRLASASGLRLYPRLMTDHGGTKVEFYSRR